jgi:hypothetical protein
MENLTSSNSEIAFELGINKEDLQTLINWEEEDAKEYKNSRIGRFVDRINSAGNKDLQTSETTQ